MNISNKKKIGKNAYTITGEGDNLYDAITDMNKASFGDIGKCGICDSDDLYLEAHLAQNKYKYHSRKCRKCRASLTFGKREDDHNVSFLRRTKEGSYDWKEFETNK